MERAIGELTWRQMQRTGGAVNTPRPIGSATTESVIAADVPGNATLGVAWGLIAHALVLGFVAGVVLAWAEWVLG